MLGPGRQTEEGQGRSQSIERMGRLQSGEALDCSVVAAAIAARAGLDNPAAAEGRRRALRAEDERLSVDGDDRIGHEKLSQSRRVRARFPHVQQREY